MKIRPEILDHWPEVSARLPADFDLEATARLRGAFTRAREIKDAKTLLRLALAYGGLGMSLRETCTWAEAGEIVSLSGPSLLDRLCKAAPWLGDIVAALIAEQAKVPAGRWAGYRLRALDGTSLCEPGADRTTWRLHVGYDLATGQVDQLELTDGRGAENLQRLTYRPGDVVLGDRCYARPRDLRPVLDAGADFIVRTGWNSLRMLQPDGKPFDLFAALATQTGQEDEVQVRVHEGTQVTPSEPLLLRLVIRRKDPEQAKAEQKRLLKEAKKRGKQPDPRSLEAAKYILLLTSLPATVFPPADILAIYRFRWQIELAFKRFKSLAGLDLLPAKNPELARAWIYARLIVAIIAEQIAGQVPDSSPCGPETTSRKSIALAAHEDSPGHDLRRHTRTTPLAGHLQPLQPNPSSPL
ncbi:MAG: IS4 family transposase [Reyranella sp.]|nr:IS4 family transposase [Reyranella sp.]